MTRRIAVGAIAGVLFGLAGSFVVLAPILGIGLAAAPFAFIAAALMADHVSPSMPKRVSAVAGFAVGTAAAFAGSVLYTALLIAPGVQPDRHSAVGVGLIITISALSLGIFYLVPAIALGLVWAAVTRLIRHHTHGAPTLPHPPYLPPKRVD